METGSPTSSPKHRFGWLAVTGAVLRTPSLWPQALRTGRRLVPRRWWRRHPPSPLPPADYVRFRETTNRGGVGEHPPQPGDILAYLKWCRSVRQVLG